MKNYREPDPEVKFENDPLLDLNKKFLTNKIESTSDGIKFEDMIANWYGDYEQLERNHAYIQWLFPIYTQGMNNNIHPLQLHELNVCVCVCVSV